MSIEISIISSPENVVISKSQYIFPDEGGTLGRASSNFWVLEDPNKYMSSVHAQVACEMGQYFLTDLSTNGTFMNGAAEPVGHGNQVQLNDGDQFAISDYMFVVKVAASNSAATDSFMGSINDDPFADLAGFDTPANQNSNVDDFAPASTPVSDPFASGINQFAVSGAPNSEAVMDPMAILDKGSAPLTAATTSTSLLDELDSVVTPAPISSPGVDVNHHQNQPITNDSIEWPSAKPEASVIPDDWDDDFLNDLGDQTNDPFAMPQNSHSAPFQQPAAVQPVQPVAQPAAVAQPQNQPDLTTDPFANSNHSGAFIPELDDDLFADIQSPSQAQSTPQSDPFASPQVPSGQQDPFAAKPQTVQNEPFAAQPAQSAHFSEQAAAQLEQPAQPVEQPAQPEVQAVAIDNILGTEPVSAVNQTAMPDMQQAASDNNHELEKLKAENAQLKQQVALLKEQLASKPTTANIAPSDTSAANQVIEAMGLGKWNIEPNKALQINHMVGTLMRETMKGLMQVLQFRKKIKEEFRINVTTIQSVENNPLKFSANIDDAMENMFIKENNAYKQPVDAVKEGFASIAEHQIAVIAGMQAAFKGMIERFDPAHLENRFEKYSNASFISLGQKGKRWNDYKAYHKELTENLDDSFQHLFGYDFVQAYEEQMQECNKATNTGVGSATGSE